MAMFTSNGSTGTGQVKARTGAETGLSILAAGLRFKGEIETDGVIKIEGSVEGTIRAEGQVLIAKGGVVDGDIHTREAVIGGQVRGAIYATERVEAQTTSVVTGDVHSPRILVHEGGQLNGMISMKKPAASGAKSSQQTPEPRNDSKNKTPFEVVDDRRQPTPIPAARVS